MENILEYKLKKFALDIRIGIVDAISAKGGGHIGGSLDLAETLSVLYNCFMHVDPNKPEDEDRDYLICSKGHAGPALYATLALKKFFPYERLYTLNQENSLLPGHCDRLKVPGVDATTGSLGQGLSIACGIALGNKLKRNNFKVYCITGDGESAEGQIWEAAQFANHYKLDNLITFLDFNKMQIDGSNDEVMTLGDPVKKYKSFGWNVMRVNGQDVISIYDAIREALNVDNGKPTMIVLDTKKGAGIPIIENLKNNHCIGFPKDMADKAKKYLNECKQLYEKEV